MGGCGAAVAEAVHLFGRIDILLCCKSEGVCVCVCVCVFNCSPLPKQKYTWCYFES